MFNGPLNFMIINLEVLPNFVLVVYFYKRVFVCVCVSENFSETIGLIVGEKKYLIIVGDRRDRS